MSDSSATGDRSAVNDSSRGTARPANDARETGANGRWLERTVPHLAGSIRKTGFWAAIVLPFLYVPILLYGLTSWVLSTAFLLLLALNLVALYVGHSHRRDEPGPGGVN